MSAYTHQGVVYFATCGRYVKIGYSAGNLEKRMDIMFKRRLIIPADIDTTQPVQVLHTIPGCIMRDERRLHGLFAAHHAIGEWFHLTPAFLLHLTRLEYVTDAEVLRRFRRARAELKRARLRQAALPRAA